MGATLGSVLYFIKARNSEFKSKMNESKAKVKEFDGQVDKSKKTLQDWTKTARKVGAAATVAFAGIVTGGKYFVDAASDARELQNVIEVSFGNMTDHINDWSEETADAMSRSNYEIRNFVGTSMAMIKSMVDSEEQAMEMSKTITQLAVDLASFRNISDERTFEAITGAITGEAEALKRLGYNIQDTAVKDYAMRQGIEKSYETMTLAEKTVLRYQLILERLADVQGDTVRTSEEYENQTKALQGEMRNLREELGEYLLPAANKIVGVLRSAVDFINDLPKPVMDLTAQAFILAGIITGIVGPLGLIVGFLPQIATGLTLIQTKFAPFLIAGAVTVAIMTIYEYIKDIRYETELLSKSLDELALSEVQARKRIIENRIATVERQLEDIKKPGVFMVDWGITKSDIPKLEQELKEYKAQLAEIGEMLKPDIPDISDVSGVSTDTIDEEKLENLIQSYKRELDLLGREGLDKELKEKENEWKDALNEAKELGASNGELSVIDKLYGRQWLNIVEKYTKEELALEKEYQNKLTLLNKEGLDLELEQLKQQEEAAIKAAEGKEKAIDAIEECYKVKRQKVRDKYKEEDAKKEQALIDEINRLKISDYQYEKMMLQREFNERSKYIKDKEALNEWFKLKIDNLNDKYNRKEKANELKKQQFLLEQREIGYHDYLKYLDKQLEGEEEYTDRWYSLMNERQNTLNSIVQQDMQDLIDTSEEMYDNEEERISWLIKQLEALKQRYVDNKVIIALLTDEIENLKRTLKDLPEEPPLNKMEQMFVNIGYSIEDAKQQFESFRDDMVQGFMDVINQAKTLEEAIKNVIDQLAQLIVKKGIVEPLVDWALGGLDIDAAHSGALVTTSGLVKDLPSFHTGGRITGLNSDERIIKVLTGERVLSRKQNEAFESGKYGKSEVSIHNHITAMDTQDILRALTKDGGAAVATALGLDYDMNGKSRDIIKGGR